LGGSIVIGGCGFLLFSAETNQTSWFSYRAKLQRLQRRRAAYERGYAIYAILIIWIGSIVSLGMQLLPF
jgi:hypothetical protein